MDILISPSKLEGSYKAPPAKSLTHRALILASLASGISHLKNILISDDTVSTINALKLLGVEISVVGNNVKVVGKNGKFSPKSQNTVIDIGNSGTTYRFLTALSFLADKKIRLKGSKRIAERPIKELLLALESLKIKTNNPEKITVDSAKSSQFLSALLLISPLLNKDVILKSKNLASAPYVAVTLGLMEKFGVKVITKNNTYIISKTKEYKSVDYKIESDYSSAAFLLAEKAISGSKIKILDLNPDSVQGDKFILEIIKKMHADNLKIMEIDMKNYPDLVPIVSVLAAFSQGKTKITNIAHLRLKESDRISSVTKELNKAGIRVVEKKDSLEIIGGAPQGAEFDTHEDHRIAMSFAVLGLNAKGKSVIKNGEVVNKSYPNFWKDLKKLGANISIN